MHSVGLEPTISAGERPQTYALDRVANGTGALLSVPFGNVWLESWYGVACVTHTGYNIQGVILRVIFVKF